MHPDEGGTGRAEEGGGGGVDGGGGGGGEAHYSPAQDLAVTQFLLHLYCSRADVLSRQLLNPLADFILCSRVVLGHHLKEKNKVSIVMQVIILFQLGGFPSCGKLDLESPFPKGQPATAE